MKRFLSFLVFYIFAISGAVAQSTTDVAERAPQTGLAVVDCGAQIPVDEAHCIVRMPIKSTFDSLEVDEESSFEFVRNTNSRFPQSVNIGSTLILLDTSIGASSLRRDRHFAREKEVIKAFLGSLPDSSKIGLATFHEQGSLELVQDFTQLASRVEGALDEVKLEGNSTHISEALSDAIKVLSDQEQILIKNVVVFSDGDEEGIDASDEVKALAAKSGVSISAVALSLTAPGSKETGKNSNFLNRLTNENFGVFASVQASRNPLRPEEIDEVEAAGSNLAKSILRSGLVMSSDNFEAQEIKLIINEPLAGYEGVTKKVTYAATATNAEFKATDPKPQPESGSDNGGSAEGEQPEETTGAIGAGGGASQGFDLLALFDEYAYLFIGAAVALLLLIIILVLSLSGGKKKKGEVKTDSMASNAESTSIDFAEPSGFGAMPTAAPAATALGYIHVKGTQQRLEITAPSVTLGRSSPSDLCIDHPSVSRQHASLRISTNGAFISDLNSTNGTKVDGKRVSREIEIRSGTVISLGKCEIIFSLA